MPGLKEGIKQIKMKEGGKATEFGKAFAKARKDFINKKIDPKTGKPAKANFMFKGKRYNVQTKEDRRLYNRSAPKGLTKKQAQNLGLTGKKIREKFSGVKSDIKAAGARKAADVKSEAAKIKKAKTFVGTALGATAPVARALTATTKTSGAIARAAKAADKKLPTIAKKVKDVTKTVKDVSAVARGKTKKVGKGRQITRDKKGRVSEVSKKNIARGQTISKKATDLKKLAATTTRIGVRKGRRTGEALRDKKGRVSGISKKTIEKGRKIRKVALTGAGAAAPTLVAKAEREEQAQKMRAGGTFKGSF